MAERERESEEAEPEEDEVRLCNHETSTLTFKHCGSTIPVQADKMIDRPLSISSVQPCDLFCVLHAVGETPFVQRSLMNCSINEVSDAATLCKLM